MTSYDTIAKKHEGWIRRVRRDFGSHMGKPWFIVLGIACAALGNLLPFHQAVGTLMGFLISVGLLTIWLLLRIPYWQRDEARAERDLLQRMLDGRGTEERLDVKIDPVFLAEHVLGLDVEIINPNAFELRVVEVALEHEDGTAHHVLVGSLFDEKSDVFLTKIPPRDRVQDFLDVASAPEWGFDVTEPVIVAVKTPLQVFGSNAVTLYEEDQRGPVSDDEKGHPDH